MPRLRVPVAGIIVRLQIMASRAVRFMPEVVTHMAQLDGVIRHVRTGRMPQPVRPTPARRGQRAFDVPSAQATGKLHSAIGLFILHEAVSKRRARA